MNSAIRHHKLVRVFFWPVDISSYVLGLGVFAYIDSNIENFAT